MRGLLGTHKSKGKSGSSSSGSGAEKSLLRQEFEAGAGGGAVVEASGVIVSASRLIE